MQLTWNMPATPGHTSPFISGFMAGRGRGDDVGAGWGWGEEGSFQM
jgi:hypothetical protein